MNYSDWFEEILKKELKDVFRRKLARAFIIRSDGTVLCDLNNDNLTQTVGALSCGLWEAARSVLVLFESVKIEDFRLSFDNSSSGIYFLPLQIHSTKYIFGVVYKDLILPAQFKYVLSVLKNKIENDQSLLDISGNSPLKNREGYLFEDITDDELNALFSF